MPTCTKCGKKYSILTAEDTKVCNKCLQGKESGDSEATPAGPEVPQVVRVYGRVIFPIVGSLSIGASIVTLLVGLSSGGVQAVGALVVGVFAIVVSLIPILVGRKLQQGKRDGVYTLILLTILALGGAIVGLVAGAPILSVILAVYICAFYLPPLLGALTNWKSFH
jgi:hypothetical protein